MVKTADMRWFKETFWAELKAATDGTVFDPDMVSAIACQETGSLWAPMRRKGLAKQDIVRLCCGDTLDAPNRSAFPKTRAHLEAVPRGAEMFAIGRKALLEMSEHVPGYGFAKNRKNKFCHGYGVFQLDIQFFKVEPDYFLERRYEQFSETLGKAMRELISCQRKRGLQDRSSISDFEFCTIAITYNTGRFRPNRGLKQGHFDGAKHYGEHINDYVARLRAIAVPDGPAVVAPQEGQARVTPPLLPEAAGPWLRVDTMTTSLRLRSAPEISSPVTKNVIADLPDGWPVRAFHTTHAGTFREVEAVLSGTVFRGFASSDFLTDAEPVAPLEPLAKHKVEPVWMPRKSASVTRRRDPANAHSLNEPGMPGRGGATPDVLRESIHGVISFLNPENVAQHARYAPRGRLTFCNIYAHDFCALCGVYLPRVWWMEGALAAIAGGAPVQPLYGNTVQEMRANDLFRWLAAYGPGFGWQRVATATALQNHANLGAVCLIIARRKNDGASGHVSMVVPETEAHRARRLPGGDVSAPLQSQAGSRNFNYDAGRTDWWKAEKFADSAMWVHP
ncbi:MAG: hypothetical protein AAF727_07870 [Pseudomonadota bacterium]